LFRINILAPNVNALAMAGHWYSSAHD